MSLSSAMCYRLASRVRALKELLVTWCQLEKKRRIRDEI